MDKDTVGIIVLCLIWGIAGFAIGLKVMTHDNSFDDHVKAYQEQKYTKLITITDQDTTYI